MTVYESDLPGVGKKHEIELHGDERLVVVTHNTGKREVFRRADADSDAEKLFELPDGLARTVGTVLEGAYFQPIATENIDTVLGGDALIEWYEVPDDSELAGETIEAADVRQRTGASIIAVEHGDEVTPNPDPGAGVHAGDTVVVIGSREEVDSFHATFIASAGDGDEGHRDDGGDDGAGTVRD
ncbi:cation:proton antiporter regulatory subunit [Halobaculum gomorrense]|uniref:Potassium/proton antiporter regulatory subunit, CPA2 family n=1 Tax=Halobaculum gomorrense TaxID=43928 RepID=A0A1M5QBE4_9EURY|nr:TrkA C-terminal domain-containing protein [Halobaculum gomorrense]SHH11206.1 potassium/proton antiporter regulatory subunit, CPA2 family [Halobaculum gomorrense]